MKESIPATAFTLRRSTYCPVLSEQILPCGSVAGGGGVVGIVRYDYDHLVMVCDAALVPVLQSHRADACFGGFGQTGHLRDHFCGNGLWDLTDDEPSWLTPTGAADGLTILERLKNF